MDGEGRHPLSVFFHGAGGQSSIGQRNVSLLCVLCILPLVRRAGSFRRDGLGKEIMGIAVPGALALLANRSRFLVDTAFIDHMGPVELAAVGVSIAVFNQV
ncbi:hypothetical protein QYE76_026144 [Lolium multiflorum]|uniref:Uncharacterized protein n=1 Tax=Lolium multiflorum TaxID=4521 RepID=A0AAD8VUV5_LOLMU|nr:hypothetical protein QYE76_026144 [Lolium multiflorum]